MKKTLWLVGGTLLSLGLVSCNNDCGQCNVVSQQFVHKYGFQMTKDEWEQRKKDGQVITALENGVVLTQNYRNGVLHGTTTYTFPNNTVICQTDLFDDGSLLKTVFHDLEGIPHKEEQFEFDNRKVVTIWDKNGVPLSVEEYQNELLVKGQYFTKEHELESSIEDGKGLRTKRDRDGAFLSKDQFENGMLTHRTAFHPNGNIQSESSFENYALHGKQTTYSPSGSLLVEMNWDRGLLDGIKTVHKNNHIVSETPYAHGQRHGIEKEWNDQGNLVAEVHWEHDLRHGSSRFYESEETLIEWFHRGQAVSLREYQMMEFREKMVAELQGNQELSPSTAR